MFTVNVSSNIRALTQGMTDIATRQIPFATSLALNRTSKAVQDKLVADVPSRFHTTRKWWLPQQPFGIKTQTSNKTNLTAAVYSKAYFAPLQEDGGTKTASGTKGAKELAIPTNSLPQGLRKSQ
jgi:hypothetical protein